LAATRRGAALVFRVIDSEPYHNPTQLGSPQSLGSVPLDAGASTSRKPHSDNPVSQDLARKLAAYFTHSATRWWQATTRQKKSIPKFRFFGHSPRRDWRHDFHGSPCTWILVLENSLRLDLTLRTPCKYFVRTPTDDQQGQSLSQALPACCVVPSSLSPYRTL
jgi:hypothetical protein